MLKPLFRWAGAKTKMKKKYGESFFPEGYDRFVEPFFGTGCVSMWIYDKNPDVEIYANDFNDDIINIYKHIQKDVKTFIERVDHYQSDYIPLDKDGRRKYYFDLRYQHGWEYDNIELEERAAMMFFLLKTSFNGFWQLNKNTNGKFGTPAGLVNEKNTVYDKQDVIDFNRFSQNVKFFSGDFEQVNQFVTPSTFLYLDPPYRDCFTQYSEDGFDDRDQTRMCRMMQAASDAGAKVSMSNKYHFDDFFEKQLSGFEVITHEVKYTAGRGAKDGEKVAVTECFIKNYLEQKEINLESFAL